MPRRLCRRSRIAYHHRGTEDTENWQKLLWAFLCVSVVNHIHLNTMINRLKDYFEEPREPESQDDFFEIETHYDYFAVSRETALEIERRLDQLPPPRWVAFRDLAGAVHRVIAAHVYRISG